MVKLVIFMGVVGSFLPGGTVVGRGVGVEKLIRKKADVNYEGMIITIQSRTRRSGIPLYGRAVWATAR